MQLLIYGRQKKAEPNVSAVRQQEGVPGKTGTPDVIANAIVQKISKAKKSLQFISHTDLHSERHI